MKEIKPRFETVIEWVKHYRALGLDVVPLVYAGTSSAGDVIRNDAEVEELYGKPTLRPYGVGILTGEKIIAVQMSPAGLEYHGRLVEMGYLTENSDLSGGGGRSRTWFFRATEGETIPTIEVLPGIHIVGSGVVPVPPSEVFLNATPLAWRPGHSIEEALRNPMPAPMAQIAMDAELRRTVRTELTGVPVLPISMPAPARVPTDEDSGAALEGWDGPSLKGKPAIEVIPDEEAMGTQALRILSLRRQDIFQRSDVLVMVSEDTDKLSGITRPRRLPKLKELIPARVRALMSSEIAFFKWKEGSNGEKYKQAVNVPDPLPANIVSRIKLPSIRQIEFVTETPSLRPDGSVIEDPGYDETTGVLYVPKQSFEKVPERPARKESKAAYERIAALFQDFPFSESRYKAMLVAACLSPLARPAFRGDCPMFFVEANSRGSGKSLIVDAIHTMLYGSKAPKSVISKDDDEMRKKITTIGVECPPIVLFDNIRHTIDSPSLEAVITSGGSWSDRTLGSNKSIDVYLNCIWFATGNNVEFAGDIPRRIARIRLIAQEERPENRGGFRFPNLLQHIEQNRSTLVVDALTIMRGYIAAGRPNLDMPNWGGFEGWSSLVRASVFWASGIDPYVPEEVTQMDSEASTMTALANAWYRVCQKIGPGPHTVKRVLDYVKDKQSSYSPSEDKCEDFVEAMHEAFGIGPKHYEDASKKVGRAISKQSDRTFGDKRFVPTKGTHDKILRWEINRIQPKQVTEEDN